MLSDAGHELQSESKREYVKIEKSSQNVKINFSQSVKKCKRVFYNKILTGTPFHSFTLCER